MSSDPEVRQEAHGILSGLFGHIGQTGSSGGAAGGLLGQVAEFAEMPMELAQIFMNMSTQLAELVLKSLEEAGIALVKGMTPV